MSNKVAVITGGNKGIGYGIVRELCRRGVGIVYLTARDRGRGEKAVEDLKKEGFNPLFHQLEVSDRNSVKTLADLLKDKHGGLDILINNAGVICSDFYKTTYEDSKKVIDINYYSNLIIQEYIFPILKDNARVLNMSSAAGLLSNLRNKYWIERLTKEDVDIEDINAFVNWFLLSVKNESMKAEDFTELPLVAYRVSKIALCALTKVQQNKVDRGISINSLHPGVVRTDMMKGAGFLNVEEASITPVHVVLDADQSLKGRYIWFDNSEKDWTDVKSNLCPRMDIIDKILQEVGYNSGK